MLLDAAVGEHLDDVVAALALRHGKVLPVLEALMRTDNLDVHPAGVRHARAQRLDGLGLMLPEQVGVGEIGLLAEQVPPGLARVILEREQCGIRADLLAAEDPRLELVMRRRVALGIVEQCEILGLLFAGGERQGLKLDGIDALIAVGSVDRGDQPGNGEALSDRGERDAEVGGDLLIAAAGLKHRAERLVLVKLVHRHALDVLGERHGDRVGVIGAGDDETRHRIDRKSGLRLRVGELLQCAQPALAGHYLERPVGGRPHDE